MIFTKDNIHGVRFYHKDDKSKTPFVICKTKLKLIVTCEADDKNSYENIWTDEQCVGFLNKREWVTSFINNQYDIY